MRGPFCVFDMGMCRLRCLSFGRRLRRQASRTHCLPDSLNFCRHGSLDSSVSVAATSGRRLRKSRKSPQAGPRGLTLPSPSSSPSLPQLSVPVRVQLVFLNRPMLEYSSSLVNRSTAPSVLAFSCQPWFESVCRAYIHSPARTRVPPSPRCKLLHHIGPAP